MYVLFRHELFEFSHTFLIFTKHAITLHGVLTSWQLTNSFKCDISQTAATWVHHVDGILYYSLFFSSTKWVKTSDCFLQSTVSIQFFPSFFLDWYQRTSSDVLQKSNFQRSFCISAYNWISNTYFMCLDVLNWIRWLMHLLS